MVRILHSADWHMDAPLRQFSPAQRRELQARMQRLPDQIARICRREDCDLVLLSGDIFDGPYSRGSYEAVARALEQMAVPVFVAPGNHDFYGESSPWFRENWPENVHIFSSQTITSVALPELSCRVYGAAFTDLNCPGLLKAFRADCDETWAVMTLHGDACNVGSPYCPVTAGEVQEAGLDYLALGHIHEKGSFSAGAGLCAWPGCPMGHGWDETGTKGVLIAELGSEAQLRFVPVEGIRFFDRTVKVGEDPMKAVLAVLPGGGSDDFYRIHLTGESDPESLSAVLGGIGGYPNLTLIDETVLAADLWESAGEDSLEGLFFRTLQEQVRQEPEEQTRQEIQLAAKLARQILLGMEVELP